MTWDKAKAKTEIRKFFINHRVSAKRAVASATDGKIYELYCLVRTLDWLKSAYPVTIRFKGSTVDFKASPGNIDRSKSYFEIAGLGRMLELHTDIEIQTLGSALSGGTGDKSGYHEIDLVLIDHNVPDGQQPTHEQLFLGVECKAHTVFKKSIIRQVLGVRREISFFQESECKLELKFGGINKRRMKSNPASLYWLAFTDARGLNYSQSPGIFEIEFKHWTP
ncbi:hypothetical protein [Rhabdaerophilum sp. SD176]|uniref:hypothetical protein n=1 Tax=Rhabdaerophilum sp. SD176 TaxID=2983548 RepID=UPI0024DF35E3|nr:hypothetical protein [Rhabdaerophilum sp. SD176]